MAFEDANRARRMCERLHKISDLERFAKQLGGADLSNDETFLFVLNFWWEETHDEEYKAATREMTAFNSKSKPI